MLNVIETIKFTTESLPFQAKLLKGPHFILDIKLP